MIGPLYTDAGEPLYAAPYSWDEFETVRLRVRDISLAALREVGGGDIDHDKCELTAPSGEDAQRAFRLGLVAAGVAFECLPWDDYCARLDSWQGSLYRVEVTG